VKLCRTINDWRRWAWRGSATGTVHGLSQWNDWLLMPERFIRFERLVVGLSEH
jgi:hypothetical protein